MGLGFRHFLEMTSRPGIAAGLIAIVLTAASLAAVSMSVLVFANLPVAPALAVSVLPPLGLALPVGWMILRLAHDLETAERRARAMGLSDPVTGLYNDHVLHEIGTQQVRLAHRYGRPLTAVLFRLSLCGTSSAPSPAPTTATADALARSAAGRLRLAIRDSDILCRRDDGTFVLLLPESDDQDATWMVERLRTVLSDAPERWKPEARFGVAPLTRPDLPHLLERAERALNDAPANGSAFAPPPARVGLADIRPVGTSRSPSKA